MNEAPGAGEEPVRNRHLQDLRVVKVNRVTFLEFDPDGEMMVINQNNDYTDGPYADGDVLSFYSVSSMLNTSLPLMEQTKDPAHVPGGASLIIYGETEDGRVIRNRIWWTYQMENCGRESNPIQVFDKVGWVTVAGISSAWPAFCTRAIGSPTITPQTFEPTLTPSASPVATGKPTESDLTSSEPTPKRTRPPTRPAMPSTMGPTVWNAPEPCVEYMMAKASKKSKSSKSTKSAKSCKSAKSAKTWSSMSYNNWEWAVQGKQQKEDRPQEVMLYGRSSRIKLQNYDMTSSNVNKSSKGTSPQSFAPAWEVMAMFVVAAALVGWKFRHELYPDGDQQEVVVAVHQDAGNGFVELDDNEDIEHEGAEDSKEEEEMEEIEGRANTATIAANPPTEERSTNEQTVHVGDVDATHAVQLITDGEEAGGVRVGTI